MCEMGPFGDFWLQASNSYLKHPAGDDLPHVGLDLLLDNLRKGRGVKSGYFGAILVSLSAYLEIVAGCQVELLDLQHVAEHSRVLYENRVLVGKGEKGLQRCRGWRQGSMARVPGEEYVRQENDMSSIGRSLLCTNLIFWRVFSSYRHQTFNPDITTVDLQIHF